jgi:hypothetical protein
MKTDKFSQALTTQRKGQQQMQSDANGTSIMEENQNTVGTSHNANRLLPPVPKSRQHLYPTVY